MPDWSNTSFWVLRVLILLAELTVAGWTKFLGCFGVFGGPESVARMASRSSRLMVTGTSMQGAECGDRSGIGDLGLSEFGLQAS